MYDVLLAGDGCRSDARDARARNKWEFPQYFMDQDTFAFRPMIRDLLSGFQYLEAMRLL